MATPTILDYALADEMLKRSQSGRVALKAAETQQRQQPQRREQEKPSTAEQAGGYLLDRAADYGVRNYIIDPAIEQASNWWNGANAGAQAGEYALDGWNAASNIGSNIGTNIGAETGSYLLDAPSTLTYGADYASTGGNVAAQAGGEVGTSYLGAAMPYLGAAAGLYGMYDTLSRDADRAHGQGRGALAGASSGAAIGGSIGSVVPGVGTAIGAGIGAVLGGAAGFFHNKFGSRKGPEQLARDAGREKFVEAGWLTPDFQLEIPTGGYFDAGKDGGARLDNVGVNIDGNTQRHYHDADLSDPRAAQTIAQLDPIFDVMFGGNEKARTDWVGTHTNAALKSGDPMLNVRGYYQKYMGDPVEFQRRLDALASGPNPQISYDRYLQYIDQLNQVMGYGSRR